MRKICFLVIAMLVLFASTGYTDSLDLQAGDTVTAALGGGMVSPKVGGITVSLDGTTYGGPGADVNIGGDAVWAGCYVWDIFKDSIQIANEYKSFCLAVNQDPVLGTPLEHDVLDTAASELKFMWGTYYDSVVNDSVKAAAFQLACWEVVHETGATFDLAAGNFFLSDLDLASPYNNGATFQGLIDQANIYLTSSTWTSQANLLVVARDGFQPFLVQVVPEPATLTLLVLGGLALLKRKSTKD